MTTIKKQVVTLSACRYCADSYLYTFPDGQHVTILVGIPDPKIKYKAISHVWGERQGVAMCCKKCSRSFSIDFKSMATFTNIMALAGPGSSIWLDNMSINQNDDKEKATVIKSMGEIYSGAELVSVLFPVEDREPFNVLRELVRKARTLLERKWRFDYRVDESVGLEGDEDVSNTAALARSFWDDIKQLLDSDVKYWQRAWTFQEWALAHDIEIGYDSTRGQEIPVAAIRHVKSSVVFAAVIIADYKLRFGQFALMDVGFTRGEVTNRIDFVKMLFPFEDAFASFEEVDRKEQRFQCALPHFGTYHIIGLRPMPRTARKGDAAFRARLFLMLDAFAQQELRKATYEADLVSCWASMCGIEYEYSHKDKLPVATAKVIRALRKRGVQIYNFHVNGDEHGLDVDLRFLDYAAAQQQISSTCMQRMPGAPVFTGCTDTFKHFYSLVKEPAPLMDWPLQGTFGGIPVKGIKGAFIKAAVQLTSKIYALGAIMAATSGTADNVAFAHAIGPIQNILDMTPGAHLSKYAVVVVAIPTSPDPYDRRYFCAWAIVTVYMPMDSLFVAREDLNGTLVLAGVKEGRGNDASIFAYLTLTDHQCGTFLIKSDRAGRIDMTFRTPLRPDASSAHWGDRHLRAQLAFADNQSLSAASKKYVNMHIPGIIFDSRIDEIDEIMSLKNNDHAILRDEDDKGLNHLEEMVNRGMEGYEKHSTVDLDIIGHPNLIPLVQREQEELRRRKAAVCRDTNKDAHERMYIAQIPTTFGSMTVTGLKGPPVGLGVPNTEDPEAQLQTVLSHIRRSSQLPESNLVSATKDKRKDGEIYEAISADAQLEAAMSRFLLLGHPQSDV